jgi:formylglycine-generating enzyme required for sulfatase activity
MAAAGGSENRLYPWGATTPTAGSGHANWIKDGNSPSIAVGSRSAGQGRWGHDDLAGSMWEWTLDGFDSNWYAGAGNSCDNCANLANTNFQVLRGRYWGSNAAKHLRVVDRSYDSPGGTLVYRFGLRCARTP